MSAIGKLLGFKSGVSTPTPPPPPPPPTPTASQPSVAAARRKSRRRGIRQDTLLTGPQGLSGNPVNTTGLKTLLGQ